MNLNVMVAPSGCSELCSPSLVADFTSHVIAEFSLMVCTFGLDGAKAAHM